MLKRRPRERGLFQSVLQENGVERHGRVHYNG